MNIAKSSLKVFISKSLRSLVLFLGIAFFANELGPNEIGIFFLFQALLGLVSIPIDFGIRSSVTKRISEGGQTADIISTAILIKLVLIMIAAGVMQLLQGYINNYLGSELTLYLVLAILLQELGQLTMAILRGELRVGETAVPLLIQQVVFVGVGAALLLLNFGLKALIYGLLAGLVILVLWGISERTLSFGFPSVTLSRSLFDYSKYSFISSIGGYFYNWMDVAIIGLFLTQSKVGIYEIAWRATVPTTMLSGAIAISIFPQVSHWEAKNASGRIESLIPAAITPALFLVIPSFFGVVMFSREILGLVFGQEYAAGWLVLIILMGEKVLQSVHIILGRSLQGINRPDLAAKAGIIAIIINLILNVVLIFKFGIVGAAVATTVSFSINSVIHAYYLSKFVSINFPLARTLEITGASIGMVIGLVAVNSILVINTLPKLIGTILWGVLLYGVIAIMMPRLRTMMIRNLRLVISQMQ